MKRWMKIFIEKWPKYLTKFHLKMEIKEIGEYFFKWIFTGKKNLLSNIW